MRRARGLQVSSTREICVFCATRQLATTTPFAFHPSSTSRRQFNSSGRSPDSVEGAVYQNVTPPLTQMSQAQRMRQILAASTSTQASAAQPQGPMSPIQMARASLSAQQSFSQNTLSPQRQPPPPGRPPSSRGRVSDGWGRTHSQDRITSVDRGPVSEANALDRPSQRSRYKVSMDGQPRVNMPRFDLGGLRRRTDLQSSGSSNHKNSSAGKSIPRGKTLLGQDELAELLGNDPGKRTPNVYQSLSRDKNAHRPCFHCNSLDHSTNMCPTKPILRERRSPIRADLRSTNISRPPQVTDSGSAAIYRSAQGVNSESKKMRGSPQFHQETVADAAEDWVRKAKDLKLGSVPLRNMHPDDSGRHRNLDDKRRRRLDLDDPEEVVNRYEQPERRRTSGRGRRMIRNEEEEDEERPRTSKKDRKKERAAAKKAAQNEVRKNNPTPISLPEYISVANLAAALRQKVEDFVQKLEDLGFEEVQNDHVLNSEHAGLIAQEYNFEPIFQASEDDNDLYPAPALEPEAYAQLPARPPVVTIMGHVDHGKTTILDYIRSTSVAATEFGGITQHIGAFSVPLANGRKITFLDTPGHAAFETMRARGANVTDIVVLVVAADDSVMPQTVEAIKHAQAANVPIIVAINKIDKAQADVDAVKLDLGRHGIEIEDFGGDVQAIGVSGKTGEGISDLEEAITTLSEMLDHRADPEAPVEGWVLEGTTKKSGRIATVLVRSGTLRQGTALVAGTTWTRVRTLRNEAGVIVKEVGPGVAVEVDGWRDQPIAGDEVLQANDEQHATAVTDLRTEKAEREQMARDMEAINEYRRHEAERRAAVEAAEKANATGEDATAAAGDVMDEVAKPAGPAILKLIVKGDVSGSVEAVIDSVSTLGNNEVGTQILRYGVGPPSEFDISHAADASGHIINFNTVVPPHITKFAEEKGVRILDSNIIYRVVETVKEVLGGMLAPSVVQKVTGEADIAAIFEIGLGGRKKLKVAGSKVRNGVVEKGRNVKVLRGDKVIYTGTIQGIKNHKKDVGLMRKDTECGISFTDWQEFQVGDKIQCYEEWKEPRKL